MVTPSGGKLWRWKYPLLKVRKKLMALGAIPKSRWPRCANAATAARSG